MSTERNFQLSFLFFFFSFSLSVCPTENAACLSVCLFGKPLNATRLSVCLCLSLIITFSNETFVTWSIKKQAKYFRRMSRSEGKTLLSVLLGQKASEGNQSMNNIWATSICRLRSQRYSVTASSQAGCSATQVGPISSIGVRWIVCNSNFPDSFVWIKLSVLTPFEMFLKK